MYLLLADVFFPYWSFCVTLGIFCPFWRFIVCCYSHFSAAVCNWLLHPFMRFLDYIWPLLALVCAPLYIRSRYLRVVYFALATDPSRPVRLLGALCALPFRLLVERLRCYWYRLCNLVWFSFGLYRLMRIRTRRRLSSLIRRVRVISHDVCSAVTATYNLTLFLCLLPLRILCLPFSLLRWLCVSPDDPVPHIPSLWFRARQSAAPIAGEPLDLLVLTSLNGTDLPLLLDTGCQQSCISAKCLEQLQRQGSVTVIPLSKPLHMIAFDNSTSIVTHQALLTVQFRDLQFDHAFHIVPVLSHPGFCGLNLMPKCQISVSNLTPYFPSTFQKRLAAAKAESESAAAAAASHAAFSRVPNVPNPESSPIDETPADLYEFDLDGGVNSYVDSQLRPLGTVPDALRTAFINAVRQEFTAQLALPSSGFCTHPFAQVTLRTKPSVRSQYTPQYKLRLSASDQLEVSRMLADLETQGIITPTRNYGWNNPALTVSKKAPDGRPTMLRLCLDFRQLNLQYSSTSPIQHVCPKLLICGLKPLERNSSPRWTFAIVTISYRSIPMMLSRPHSVIQLPTNTFVFVEPRLAFVILLRICSV